MKTNKKTSPKKTLIILKNISKILKYDYLIDDYMITDLKMSKELHLDPKSLTTEEINNLILVSKKSTIIFKNIYSINDEIEYFKHLIKIFKILNTHNRRYKIKITVQNRRLLKESRLFKYLNNIDLTINNCSYDYSKEEYLEEEKRLDQLIKPIKESNLSPYEKYLAVYNIVKQFKPYKDSIDNPQQSRTLKYILDNEFIVCVGYSMLLKVLLNKIGIPCSEISTRVSVPTISNIIQNNTIYQLSNHRRNIVKIDDPKYNIHGIYLADATWDNSMKDDLYLNHALTFDRKKESENLEGLTPEDLLLDFHNFKEFSNKINYFFKKEIKKSTKTNMSKKIIQAYIMLYKKIMEIIVVLDYQKYKELSSKYADIITKSISDYLKERTHSLKYTEEAFSNFLTEYYYYIIMLVNNAIDEDITFKAAKNVKKNINGYTKKQLAFWEQTTQEKYESDVHYRFPYVYDPNITIPNYLEVRVAKLKIKSKK